MTAQENKEIVRRYFEGRFNDKDYSVVDQYLAPDAIPTPDQQKAWLDGFHAAWEDAHVTLNHLISEDDLVAVHWSIEGTFKGEWDGHAPTGKRVQVSGMALCWLADGMLIRDDVNYHNGEQVLKESN
jgi:predicted ester cyclase